MPYPKSYLVVLAREALNMNQKELAEFVGSSLRTVQRWEVGRAPIYSDTIQQLADAVRPTNPDLAAQLEAYAPRPAPPPAPVPHSPAPPPLAPAPVAPPPPAAPAIPVSILVEAVVCAAAEAMSVPPQAVRPAVLAAFTRARDAGLSPETVVAVLAPPPPAPPADEVTASRASPRRGGPPGTPPPGRPSRGGATSTPEG